MTTAPTIDPRHTAGTDLSGDAYLESLADAFEALRRVFRSADRCHGAMHKGVRESGTVAVQAWLEACPRIEGAIEVYMKAHPQPVTFVHNGWRWAIPSAGRGLICTAADHEASRAERKRGEL